MKPFSQAIIQLKNVTIHLMYYDWFDTSLYLDHLTTDETERFFSFKHENRKQEFLATRILRHQLFGFTHIHYNNHGAPYIEDEGFISISHAPGVVGIAVCHAFQIGLDIEPMRPKAHALQEKFLSEAEKICFDTSNEVEMTKVWSAKEALYKLAGRKQLIFKKELLLDKSTEEVWRGTIINPTSTLKVDLNIFVKDHLVISINDSEVVPL